MIYSKCVSILAVAVSLAVLNAKLANAANRMIDDVTTLERGCALLLHSAEAEVNADVVAAAQAASCSAVMSAYVAVGPLLDSKIRFCAPELRSTADPARVFLRFVTDNPAARKMGGLTVMLAAFRAAWPCRSDQ